MSEAVVPHDSTRSEWLSRLERARYPVGLAALAGLYYAGAKTGYLLEFAGPVAAIVWLPVGVGIAFLYLGGLRYWPGVLIGDLLANDYMTLPLGSALGQTCGNVLEVVRRPCSFGASCDTARRSGACAASGRSWSRSQLRRPSARPSARSRSSLAR